MKVLESYCTENYSEVVVLENGKHYALDGWNGERYYKCFEIDSLDIECVSDRELTFSPIYDTEPNENDGYDVIGYEID